MNLFWLGSLAMGFAGSGHCGAMCGGIASSAAAMAGGSARRRTLLSLSLNVGRLLAYAAAGALVGGIGSLMGDMSVLRDVSVALRGALGVMLIGLGGLLAVGARSFALLDRVGAPLWRLLRPYAQRLSGPRTPVRAFAFGALWGFLPCGLVYVALGIAGASGSSLRGALSMVAFGAGTVPALVLIGSFGPGLRRLASRTAVRLVVGLIVASSGVVNVGSAWPDVWGVRVFAATTHACCHARGEQ